MASAQIGFAEEKGMTSTKEVLDRHLGCFAAGDLVGILSDYAPDAVLFAPRGFASSLGAMKGTNAIKQFFATVFAEFGKPGTFFDMKQASVEGDYAYILWTAKTADNVYEVGSDTFVVRDGKIVAQSFAGKITPKCGRPLL
jgi:ketosteroid isomerase-like protein